MPFDEIAPGYDSTFGRSPAGRLFRFRLAERVAAQSKPPARILDVGCGTGEDAVWLARQGFVVHGIDESAGMIEVARNKAARLRSTATFECRSVQSLSTTDPGFDVVISDFGALNCLTLAVWTAIIPQVMAPAGRGLVVLMGRRPLPEGLRKGFSTADRGDHAEVRLGSGSVTAHYDSVSAVCEALGTRTIVNRVEALGCLVAGPGYVGFARRHPISMGLLAMAECVIRTTPCVRGRGDHTLFEFTKR